MSSLGGQLKRLGKHSVIYGLGGLVSRILAVLLLPLYTRYLSPSDYGKVETLIALTTVIGIVLRMGISSAFFRFYFDSPEPGRPAPRSPDVVLVHDGAWRRRARPRARCSRARSPSAVRLERTTRARHGGVRRALGGDELRAAHVALPRRGALGRVRVGEPHEHPRHGRRDAAARRRRSTRGRSA